LPSEPNLQEPPISCALELITEPGIRNNRGKLSKGESDYYDVLILLIEDYEKRTFPDSEKCTPGEILEFMMEQHGLKQIDLLDELGSQTTVSLILNDRRNPTAKQAAALAKRFHVPPLAVSPYMIKYLCGSERFDEAYLHFKVIGFSLY
jgi:antitoxin component HigA of HigAB toxin-antitoxin module